MEVRTIRAKCLGDELKVDLPVLWQARAARFQVGIFKDEALSESDFANVLSFELYISRDRSETSTLVTSSLLRAAMDTQTAITLAAWEVGSAQHLTFQLTDSQMAVALQDAEDRCSWTVRASLTGGSTITLGAGYISIREDGAGSAPPPPEPGIMFYTKTQVDALLAANGKIEIVTGSDGAEYSKFTTPQGVRYREVFTALP